MTYIEYPRCLHKPDGSTCLVGNDAEKAAKLAEGWRLLPGGTVEAVAEPPADVEDAPKKSRKKKDADAA